MSDFMWNKAYKIAGYIVNRTLTKRLKQRIFFEIFIKSIFTMVYIYLFSYKVFFLIYKTFKLAKMSPKVQIGYLYNYNSTNIFRIWLFIQDKIIRIRDVKFNDNNLYYPSDLKFNALRDIEVKKIIKLLKILNIINEFSRGVEEDLESEYNNNIIIINILKKSTFKSI